MQCVCRAYVFFFFNDTATTEIYTLSLHDALPISTSLRIRAPPQRFVERRRRAIEVARLQTTLDASGVRLDGEADPVVHRRGQRLRTAHPAQPPGEHDAAAQRVFKVPGRDRSERRSEERRVGKECRSRWSP